MQHRTIKKETMEWFRNILVSEERGSATIQKYMRDIGAFSDFVGTEELSKTLTIAYKRVLAKNTPQQA